MQSTFGSVDERLFPIVGMENGRVDMSKNFMIDFDPFDFTKLLELKMEAENGEWGENERIELMARYQRYRGIVEEQAYVIRGSVLTCQYGTKEVRIDCAEDHGVYVGSAPLMTCEDCQHSNIYEFGSCRCPEAKYVGRLPVTPSFFPDLSRAEKAPGNNLAHICRPLINLEQGWRQIDEELLIESHAGVMSPALLSNAVLVCNYGGIIRIREVAERIETSEEETLEEYIKDIMTTLGWTAKDDEVSEIKKILEEFGITDRISIACFLLLCITETGAEGLYSGRVDRNGQPYVDEYERAVTEYYPVDKNGYKFEERGVGYIQVTGYESQLACLRYLEAAGYYQEKINESALGYVEELRSMPWESAAWRWAVFEQTGAGNLNAYIAARAKDNGDKLTLGMVLTAESFINGQVSTEENPPEKISKNPNESYNTPDDALAAIARGKIPQMIGTEKDDNHWYTVGDYLYVGGWRYRAPNNWTQFMANYYRLFPEEERWQMD